MESKNGSSADELYSSAPESRNIEVVTQSLLATQFSRPLRGAVAAAAVICLKDASACAPMEWLTADRNCSRLYALCSVKS